MMTTTMKHVEQFKEPPQPSEVAEILDRISGRCYSAFGEGGTLTTLILSESNSGGHVLVAIVEVEANI